MPIALARWLNKRLIELYADTQGETVGVLMRSGEYRFVRWLGFVGRREAVSLGRPVKLKINRIGHCSQFGATWEDVAEGRHVQGCLVEEGVYAVVDENVRLI